MLFAIADYIHYRRRSGRFSREPSASIMAGAFQGELSAQALALLRPGDVIFLQTLDWPMSWVIMYLTSSEVSHVAFYVGGGQIAHATLGGVQFASVTATYGESSRMLPCIWPMPDEKRTEVVELLHSKFRGVPYGWAAVRLKATRILMARDWPYFRWKFAFDFAVIIGVLDIPFLLAVGAPVLLWMLPAYLCLVTFNAALWRVRPLPFTEWTGKPIDVLRMLQAVGGHFVMDAYSLRQHSETAQSTPAPGSNDADA